MNSFHISQPVSGWVAAAISPLFSTVGIIAWDKTWKKSAFYLNLFKCALASSIFLFISLLSNSFSLKSLGSWPIIMLCLSSLLGIVIGDNMWLSALKMIGSRRVITVDALKPFISEFFGVILLREKLYPSIILGIILSSVGVLIVALETEEDIQTPSDEIEYKNSKVIDSLEKDETNTSSQDIKYVDINLNTPPPSNIPTMYSKLFSRVIPGEVTSGYLLSLGNVIFDSYGAVITKYYGQDMDDWEINTIRFGFAAIVMGFYAMIVVLVPISFRFKETLIQHHHDIMLRGSGLGFSRLPTEESTDDSREEGDYPFSTWESTPQSTRDASNAIELQLNENGLEMIEIHNEEDSSQPHENENNNDPNICLNEEDASKASTCMSRNDWLVSALGVLSVTFVSSALSNYALFVVSVGIWVTLTSLGPLYSLPLVYIMKGEKVSFKACVGACFAVAGVVFLCFRF